MTAVDPVEQHEPNFRHRNRGHQAGVEALAELRE
jgi:hypothetical protein